METYPRDSHYLPLFGEVWFFTLYTDETPSRPGYRAEWPVGQPIELFYHARDKRGFICGMIRNFLAQAIQRHRIPITHLHVAINPLLALDLDLPTTINLRYPKHRAKIGWS